MSMTKFYLQKQDGSHEQVSEADFRKVYGAFVIRNLTAETPGWRIKALKDIIDAPAGTSVFVTGTNGQPLEGVPVQMYYSTAPEQPGSAPPNGLPIGVTARGDVGHTDANGHSGWAWGDAYYSPQDPDPGKRKGPYCYWIPDGKPCESIDGVGMLPNTNHRRYNIYIEYTQDGPPPEPEPPEEGELEERVTALEQQMVDLDHMLQNIHRDVKAILGILEECDG
jgi:hypothetical protein